MVPSLPLLLRGSSVSVKENGDKKHREAGYDGLDMLLKAQY